VHWVILPGGRRDINPDNPVLNIRSFARNPQAVAAQVAASSKGAHSIPTTMSVDDGQALSSHGDTSVDSHH